MYYLAISSAESSWRLTYHYVNQIIALPVPNLLPILLLHNTPFIANLLRKLLLTLRYTRLFLKRQSWQSLSLLKVSCLTSSCLLNTMIIIIIIISIFHIIFFFFCFRSLGLIRNMLRRITRMALFFLFFFSGSTCQNNSIKGGKKRCTSTAVSLMCLNTYKKWDDCSKYATDNDYRNYWYTLTALKYFNMLYSVIISLWQVYQIRKQCLSHMLIGWFGSNWQVLFASKHDCWSCKYSSSCVANFWTEIKN